MPADGLIISTDLGLYCPAGDFHIDAWGKVRRNIVTHAHSDHARSGAGKYLATTDGAALLRHRLGNIALDTLEYGRPVRMGGVAVSLHPAGHVLGSAQVRVESAGGEVWVISGDYKRQADATCRPFELVRCHTFITECTFGLPIFRWDDGDAVAGQINDWWRGNVAVGRTSLLLAYSLGKAQRVLAGLDAGIGPILLHGAAAGLTEVYRQAGVALPAAEHASVENARRHRGRALVIAPPSAMSGIWARKFSPFSSGIASGWMRVRGFRRRAAVDRGFVLSDHVDFPSLMQTIAETGAQRVIATHGYTDALAKLLKLRGMTAEALETRFGDDEQVAADSSVDPAQGDQAPDEDEADELDGDADPLPANGAGADEAGPPSSGAESAATDEEHA